LNRKGAKDAEGFFCWFVLILEERSESEQTKPFGRLRGQFVDHSFDAVLHEGDVPVEEKAQSQMGQFEIVIWGTSVNIQITFRPTGRYA